MSNLGFPKHCIDAYLAHVIDGKSLGFLAGQDGGHRSTHLRRVRRIEELRDNPEWDAIVTRLTEHRLARGGEVSGAVSRDTVCAALSMTLGDLHADFSRAAQMLCRREYYLLAGDVPRAAIGSPDGVRGHVSREVALAAIALGWIVSAGRSSGRARKYVAAKTITECFAPPSFTQDEPKLPLAVRSGRIRYSAPLNPLEALSNRKGQTLVTVDHLRLGQEFHEIYTLRESAMAVAFDQITQALPPRIMQILTEVCGKHTGFEEVEQRMSLPARSAKAVIAFALDSYGHARNAA